MKRLVVVLLVIAMLFLVAADKPPKPPKLVQVEVVNKAGEDVLVSFTGLGYDFQNDLFVGSWGNILPRFYSATVPGTIETKLPSGVVLVTKLPVSIKRVDVLKDLYVLDVTYAREIVPEGSNAAGVICLNTWVPPKYYGSPTYYPARYARQKLVIKPCNSVPVNLGAPSAGILKYNRYLLATSGYSLK